MKRQNKVLLRTWGDIAVWPCMSMNGIKAQNVEPLSEAKTILNVSWQVVRSNEECNKTHAAIQTMLQCVYEPVECFI